MGTIHLLRKQALVTTLLCLVVATPVLADDADLDKETTFDIAAQALDSALLEFSDQANVQVMVAANDLEGIQTEGIQGKATPRNALSSLLGDTGLGYQTVGSTITVSQESEDSTPGKFQPASSQVLMAQNQASAQRNRTSQDSETNNENDERPPVALEEILVTGSRIRGAENASPVVTITREDIDRAGFATVEEFVDKLPQNFGGGASLDTNTDFSNAANVVGGVVDARAGGTSINLRGLGASSTLILLNGRRMSPSGQSARFTNVASIPISAIDRVEVLTDGASAIYGSDAIGGVVNFILRDDYEGAETRLRYGVAKGGAKPEVLVGQSFGKSWDDGNVLLTYEYYDTDNLANSDRDFTSTNDLSRFGGTDWRLNGGSPANIFADGRLWAIPAGQDGTSLTSSDFPIDTNGDPIAPPNRFNERSLGDVIPAVERHSAFLLLTQSIGPVELFAEAQFSAQETQSRVNFGIFDLTIPGDDPLTPAVEGNPFFVDPTGIGLTTVTVTGWSAEDDLGPSLGFSEIDSSRAALGGRFDMGDNWSGEVAANWSKEEAISGTNLRFFEAEFFASLAATDPDLAYNPFGDGSNTNPALLESLTDRSRLPGSKSDNELWSVGFNIDGKLYDIPGGAIQVASGVDFREESLLSVENVGRPTETVADLSRDVTAVYAELFFPLVGRANSRPGLQQLEVSLAARYEDYNDFGDTVNPKVGVVWAPTETLTFRGTWGTSYRAPALTDLDVANPANNNAIYFPQLFVDLGLIPFPVIVRQGGSEDLQPEEATTWTAGVQWDSVSVKGLSVDLTYFNIDFEDRIDIPGANAITGTTDPRFATLLTLNPTPEQIAALVNDPRWLNLFGIPDADLLSGVAPVGGILDSRKTNLSQEVVTGIDLQLAYDFETALGSLALGLNANYLFNFERRFIAADPLVDEVDTFGRPIDFRARGNVTWTRNGWSATGFVNYTDGYTDNLNNNPARSVVSWTTVDLTIAYDTGDNRGFLSDTRLSLTTQNLFDEDPPFVNTLFGLAYDSANGNPLGRFMSFQVTKDW